MSKDSRWQLLLGASLIALSACLYLLHYSLFRDAHHILIYLLGDVAFLPLEVLIVTLILHRLLVQHERRAMLKKMNMVIGAFFSEVGTPLLARLVALDPGAGELRQELALSGRWSSGDFRESRRRLAAGARGIPLSAEALPGLRTLLTERRGFLLGLLENPNLLEHDAFTELLWAVFHLTEELACRRDLAHLPRTDLEHLGGDATRAYTLLVIQWLDYMAHLKGEYPYLFSLEARMNPFNPQAGPEVR